MNPRKKTVNKKLVALVASVVLLTQVASTMPVFANGDGLNNVGSTKTIATNVDAVNDEVYTVLFDGTEKTDWKDLIGEGTHAVEDGWLKVTRDASVNNEFTFFDQNAPQFKDGEAEMVFKVDGDDSRGAGRFGFVLRPQNDGNYLFVGYDLGGNWRIGTKNNNKDFSGPSLEKGQEYKLKVRFEGKKITVWVNDEQVFSENVDLTGMPVDSSYGVGFKTWYGNNDSYVDYFRVGPVGSLDEELPKKPIQEVNEVSAETFVRLAPKLPAKVGVTYEDGTLGQEVVNWDYVSRDLYANEGTFETYGTIEGRETRVTANVTVKADPEDGTLIPPVTVVEEKTIQSGDMTVVLDNNFPRVIRYEWSDGEILNGEEEQLYLVELNGTKYIPSVEFTAVDDKTADYKMTFDSLDLVMNLRLSVTDDNKLRMEVTNIDEEGSYKVRTISFPGHSLASVKSNENGQISSVLTVGDWNNIKEEFISVQDAKIRDHKKTYAIINDDKFAIAVDNNVIEGGNRAVINVSGRDGYKQAGISNGTWTYRESSNSVNTPTFTGKIGTVDVSGANQVIVNSEIDIKDSMGKEFEAVYCGLGAKEDYAGKDLTGKVALVDRGTYALVDKAKFAMEAGAEFLVMINNQEGLIPEQGFQDGANVIGIDQRLGDSIKEQLSAENTIKVSFKAEESNADVVPGGPEELPWSEVMIARDTNSNGRVTWQDAAIIYRENMDEVQGADYVRNSFSYIPFNIGSLAQSPFLRTGDMVKKLSNYTDGFGQLVLEKGYQGEGHDDVIADIGGHTGIRQGGKDDLNKLIEIGKDYNAKIGVHVNATEYHLDAFELDVNNLQPGFRKGWGWKDESYYVDQKKDVTTGELARRFGMLKEDHPDLGWVYVDVYTGNGWNANELAEIINGNDWMLATEFNGPLEQQTAWTHWGGDPAYPNRGNESKIIRFIRNQEQDVFMSDDLLKGAKHTLSGGWGTRHDVEGFYAIETFYNQTLPSKYMQHFEIQEWEDDGTTGFVKFNDGLETRRENGVINMYQDGNLIASTDHSTIDERGIGKTTLFMPWKWEQLNEAPENKVYHWNPYGGETTWDLPKEWAGTETIKLYELSDLGKTFVEEIQVINGKVTIDAKQNTPYVVFQEKVNENRIDSWGEGTLINDPGFDSQTLENWEVTTTASNTDHIKIVNENVERRKGNDAVVIEGNNGADAKLAQEITGLIPGKTYTASVWVKSDADRDVTLGVNCGGKNATSKITRATTRTNVGEGLKWHGEKATRMRVEFTVPEGVDTAKLYLEVSNNEEGSRVLVDDFRIWTNPLNSEKTNRDGYVLFEDFENVDEGHGPLYMGQNLGTDNRTHYAEKNPAGGQYMNWVINDRFSLKTNQQEGTTGEMLLTDESTLQLKPNTKYEIGFKYTNKLDNLYSVAIKSKTDGNLFKHTLTPGNVEGRPEDGPAYSREVKDYKFEFTTGNASDYYLAFEKAYGFDELVLDDLYIKDLTPQDIVVSKPSNLKASEVTSNSVSLTWNAPSETVGLEGYTIYKDGKVVAEVNDATSYTAEGLKSNSIYGFKVVAKYSNGEISKPVSINVRTSK
ncbi:endo-alpha-N-acetylgalactosaminidase family protein [Clostridium sp.]|uniref:endo-alpha-N-acetylgalactosaminidase family protein n=1 Tax=Clostridium sp. TaxID=1506 RepID=UPI003F4190F5